MTAIERQLVALALGETITIPVGRHGAHFEVTRVMPQGTPYAACTFVYSQVYVGAVLGAGRAEIMPLGPLSSLVEDVQASWLLGEPEALAVAV